MLYKTRRPGNYVIAIAMALILITQPVYARRAPKVLGLAFSIMLIVGFWSNWHLEDEFNEYTRQQRRLSANPGAPAAGAEKFYHPDQYIITYRASNHSLIPNVSRVKQVEQWSHFDSTSLNMHTRIQQLQQHNHIDYLHWESVHKNRSAHHFERYIATLAAYCETGGTENVIHAFHDPLQDTTNFRNTCRQWLDHTIDKTGLLLGSNTNSPVVLAPIWQFRKNKLEAAPQIYYVLNPAFQPGESAILYDDSPDGIYLRGADAHLFQLYQFAHVSPQAFPENLRHTSGYPRLQQPLPGGELYINVGSHRKLSAPYLLENRQAREFFLIFRNRQQLEVWPLYRTWSANWSPVTVPLENNLFTLEMVQ